MTTGVLLLNLGSPDAPTTSAVRRFLRVFLSDPLVIDLPAFGRYLLLYAVILPFRPRRTAEAYQAIWTDQGSPLVVYSQQLQRALQEKLGVDFYVALGMRYGQPSIDAAVSALLAAGCDSVRVLPLFPQFSQAATGSAIEAARRSLARYWAADQIQVREDFYDHPGFIEAWVAQISAALSDHPGWETLLFSYHGLPVRQLVKQGCLSVCPADQVCPVPDQRAQGGGQSCYRAQCYQTSRLIAQGLDLLPNQYQVCFQSRLGRTPWIAPYTDEVLSDLAQQGMKNIAIACPSFVADCLETLEEIGIRAQAQWKALGGKNVVLIPCLNVHKLWVDALATIVKEQPHERTKMH